MRLYLLKGERFAFPNGTRRRSGLIDSGIGRLHRLTCPVCRQSQGRKYTRSSPLHVSLPDVIDRDGQPMRSGVSFQRFDQSRITTEA